MTSADFCTFSAAFLIWPRLLLSGLSMQISPGTTRFFPSIYLPHLSRMIPCSYWASACVAVLPSCGTLYVVSVRQARGLPVVSLFPHPASFRFHLTTDTLAFGYVLPATGRIRVFHPLEKRAPPGARQKSTRDQNHGPRCFCEIPQSIINHQCRRWDLNPYAFEGNGF